MDDNTFKHVAIRESLLTREAYEKLTLEAVSQCCKINRLNPLAVAQNIDRMYNAIKFMEDYGFLGYQELFDDIKKEQ
jgi:hypothetical protein